jgi:hypothetical protein
MEAEHRDRYGQGDGRKEQRGHLSELHPARSPRSGRAIRLSANDSTMGEKRSLGSRSGPGPVRLRSECRGILVVQPALIPIEKTRSIVHLK